MERYVCVHGHFYQPPRENPWLEAVQVQDSAYPYHDWNERVTAECYAPNSASPILDSAGWIVDMFNNYGRISFDFGPTLLAWLETNAPQVYQAVLEADRESRRRFSGHGSAMAQAYNHTVLPLASRRDKYTQVLWGLRDFEHRYRRTPEGMWLPEAAVDLETLDILAELGIRFTVLAPHQARHVRKVGESSWRPVGDGSIDPGMSYLLSLPSGRTISLFFYDGPISWAVAFERLLASGEELASRLLNRFPAEQTGPRLVHIATDGETYGHHHKFGDMALAYALRSIESRGLARITNYGEYLEKHPPTQEVQVHENTSWSCPHGVERWCSHCGCSSGLHPGWNQAWRGPLREALDWLRDTLVPLYERKAAGLLRDPWAARDDYIHVVLDRSARSIEGFLGRHASSRLTQRNKVLALKLLELQRHAMLMYTSCGWYFDDLSRIETAQVLQYAGRAMQLAQELFGDTLEPRFLELLQRARSNLSAQGNGRTVYERHVRLEIVGQEQVAAHYAVSSLFQEYGVRAKVGAYTVNRQDYKTLETGPAKLVMGKSRFTSQVTLDSLTFAFCVLHRGGLAIKGGVRHLRPATYQAMAREIGEAFGAGDLAAVDRLVGKYLGESACSARSLFRDTQREVMEGTLASALVRAEAAYRPMDEERAPGMRLLADVGAPMPKTFRLTAEFFINTELRRLLAKEPLDQDRILALMGRVRTLGLDLDAEGLGYLLTRTVEGMTQALLAVPGDLALLERLVASVATARSLPVVLNLWNVQHSYFVLLRTAYGDYRDRAGEGEEDAQTWVARFKELGGLLQFKAQ